ncbi:unnamed protein product [Calypogeia fissa]
MASESRRLRSSGNQAYQEGCADYLAPVLRSGRLLKASKFYRQAFDASRSEDERAKCCKNLGAVHWKHAKLFLELFPEGKGSPLPDRSPTFDIELSIEHYLAALRHGRASNQSAEWRQNIKKKMEEMSNYIVDQGDWVLSKAEFITNVNKLFGAEVSSGGKCQAWAILCLGFAQNAFDRAVKELRLKDVNGTKKNYRQSLALLHSCDGPLEEADRRARPEFVEEVRTLKTSVDNCRSTCESIQASVAGQKLMEESLKTNDKAVRHDLVISALDKFKEAAVLARGVDAECEAEAMAQVGDVYREVFKKDQQAHPYYNVAVLLAQNSDAMLSAKWYQKAKVALNLFFKKSQEAKARQDEEDSEVLGQVKREVEKLEMEFKKLKTEEFLTYLYREYPPRGNHGNYRLGDLSTAAATRHALRKAIQHYHPDHNGADDDPQWIGLCGEITKLLLEKHRVFSTDCRS